MSDEDQNTLIAYGSLMPGKSNFHIVGAIPGNWSYGSILGNLINSQWEQLGGYRMLSLDKSSALSKISVAILKSINLTPWWSKLDYFEGDAYERILIPYLSGNHVQGQGWVYVIRDA